MQKKKSLKTIRNLLFLFCVVISPLNFSFASEIFLYSKDGEKTLKGMNLKEKQIRHSPCSTFKIPNTVFGLEHGFIKNKSFKLKYDSKKNPAKNWWPAVWSKDHSLDTAIKNSVVWYYQEVARQIGKKAMQSFIEQSNYGNKDLTSPIDQFWLGASLRISPEEQIQFLKKLFANEFNFSPKNISILKEILVWKILNKQTIYAKTGSCDQGNGLKGAWLVGFVESSTNKNTYFAYYTEHKDFQTASEKRNKQSLNYLKKYKLIP